MAWFIFQATSLTEAPTTAGTYAQFAVVSESVLGLKPKTMSAQDALSLHPVEVAHFADFVAKHY